MTKPKKDPKAIEEHAADLLDLALSALNSGNMGHAMFINGTTGKAWSWDAETLKTCTKLAKALGTPLISLRKTGCMWNPKENRRAKPGDSHNKRTKATVRVGAGGLSLCEKCSQLPRFKKLRKREPIES